MKRVLVAGELNVDLILHGPGLVATPGREALASDYLLTLGSASAICAVGLARLGTPVSFVGVAGVDAWGDFCLRALAEAGVDVAAVRRDPSARTGLTVAVSSCSDRALVTFPGAIGALSEVDVTDRLLDAVGHLHVSSYFLQERLQEGCARLFARAKARGLTTSLDPGCDPANRWALDLGLLRHVDLFFPNETEATAISGRDEVVDALRTLCGAGTAAVVKLGAHGAMTCDGARIVRMSAIDVAAVDSTGAGDSFDAGFLHAWLSGRSLPDSLRLAIACGGLSTRGLGGTTRQASLKEAEEAGASVRLLESEP